MKRKNYRFVDEEENRKQTSSSSSFASNVDEVLDEKKKSFQVDGKGKVSELLTALMRAPLCD